MKSKTHGGMPCTDHATPETTSGNMVNDPVGTVEVQNLPTPDTSFAAFLIEPEPEDVE